MPVGFLHLNTEMTGGFLEIGKRQIPLGTRDATDLVETRHRISHMRRIGHGLFTGAGKGKSRGRKRGFFRRGKAALRRPAIRHPGGFCHVFIFLYGLYFARFMSQT